MSQRIEEDVKAAVENPIKRVHVGVLHKTGAFDRSLGPLREASRREPLEFSVEQHQRQQAKHEDRE